MSRLPLVGQVAYSREVAPVILIGSACFDVKGSLGPEGDGGYQTASSNPGRVRVSLGGTARNIAESLARLDVPVHLLTAIGDDEQGRAIIERTRAAGVAIDDEDVIVAPGATSGAYLALLRADGQLLVGVDDTHVTHAVTPRTIHRWRRTIRAAAFVVVDANLRPGTIRAVLRLCRWYGVRACLDPVSVALARRLAPCLGDAALITPNMREAAALSGLPVTGREEALAAARALRDRGAGIVVVTLAGGGAVYVAEAASGHVPAMETAVVDATGAGDALTAGVIYGLLNDFPLDDAIVLGTAMASFTMGSSETVRSDLTLERVYDHLKL
ncbi:MAG: hypothetical protein AVDCRST_MAG88-2660 [uncultured Thermomicrobiales bacterium]|uniref:Carbohydrate kinase PfkB domain-containing protein n=1 Tax=uncultured Thermomicrobiales bacterium TaxID=1645740 RepID=A0A6J4VHY1_9BACT|nr:MAG: hypothetical protein AVDCRST_MAG88-2660 [uncultured Thermomicrobiales bacterium]